LIIEPDNSFCTLPPHSHLTLNHPKYIPPVALDFGSSSNDFSHLPLVKINAYYISPLIQIVPLPVLPSFILTSLNISTKTFLFNKNMGSNKWPSKTRNCGHAAINLSDLSSSSGNFLYSQAIDVGILNDYEKIN
jgi:hypothetical protein